jgi:hypothetical protein
MGEDLVVLRIDKQPDDIVQKLDVGGAGVLDLEDYLVPFGPGDLEY